MSNAVLIGPRRVGKSTLSLAFAATKSATIIIWDPNYQYRMPGVETVRTNEVGAWLERTAEDEDDVSICRIGPFEDSSEVWDHFRILGNEISGHEGYALIADESSMLQSPQKAHPALERFLRRSSADTWIIQSTHRAYELGQLTRQLCDDLMVFRTESKRERDYLNENYLEGMGERTLQLHDREFLHWYRREAGHVACIERRDASAWRIDLGNRNHRLTADTTIKRKRK